MPSRRLSGTVALITGGGSGLGNALVGTFVGAGARVVVLERSSQKAAELAAAHPEIEVVVGDVTVAADTTKAVRHAVATYGQLDCLVANAGIWDFGTSAAQLDVDNLDSSFGEVFGVNVKAVLLGAMCAREQLRRVRGNVIVTLSGGYAYPGGGGPLYVASKHAAHGLIRQLAYEWAPEIRVNGVAPGVMHSDLRGPGALGQDHRVITELLPQEGLRQRTVTAHDVVPADYSWPYVLLASPRESPTTTGTVIDLTGTRVRGRRDRERAREFAMTNEGEK